MPKECQSLGRVVHRPDQTHYPGVSYAVEVTDTTDKQGRSICKQESSPVVYQGQSFLIIYPGQRNVSYGQGREDVFENL